MRTAAILGGCVFVLVIVQYVVPGAAVYHAGWYNVALAWIAIWLLLAIRRARAGVGASLFAFGALAIAFAGVASGLFGFDDHTIVAAPGSAVNDGQAGVLRFPLLDRSGALPSVRGSGVKMNALVRGVPRTVVAIDARDARGAHLTITQPTGSTFLSPVLLMQSHQAIGGLSLPYDSFALPSAHRLVKAVLFSEQEAATLPALAAAHAPVVLFDLEDETGSSLPHGIGVAANDRTAHIGGLSLTPSILSYPAAEVIAIPNLAAVAIGACAILIGVLLTLRPNPGTMPQR